METKWTDQDGFSENISLKSILSWSEDKRNAFFDELNEFTVSNYGGALDSPSWKQAQIKVASQQKKVTDMKTTYFLKLAWVEGENKW